MNDFLQYQGGLLESKMTDVVAARTIREWISGERTECRRIFFVSNGADPSVLDGVIGGDDVVLLPLDCDWSTARAREVRYAGQLLDVGDELFINGRSVELQDYLSAGFVEIVGPTAVRFFDEAGWRAFFDDADLARQTGVFPAPLVDPRVVLADRNALDAERASAAPLAVRLDADGAIGLGMQGIILGHTDDLGSAINRLVSRAEAFTAAVPAAVVDDDLVSRPWLPRYLRAAELIKMLRIATGAIEIDGFGWSHVTDERADAEPLSSDPFLVNGSEGILFANVASRRRQLLTPLTADVVSILQTSSYIDLAHDRVAARHGTGRSTAANLCSNALELLSVNLGAQRIPEEAGLTGSVL
ncbi:daptide biosynthesis RiPP recognition protein [Microbacterium foliorum]|uniref:daptide biosynthesis RiPP recognition protein n=1 Tax=Microbacterium foliorum TaxID=104336 RepID=UPI001C1F3ACB|nr:daptide biosynthesis RiPP recognition protein [Microbacterium foliorum]